MKLIKKIDPRMIGRGYSWRREDERLVNVDVTGSIVSYCLIKFGPPQGSGIPWNPRPSRIYHGIITRQTEDEIEFDPITKKDLTKWIFANPDKIG